jgi:protein subunit release factor A
MLDKLVSIEERYAELETRLNDPAVLANNREFAKLAKERAQLQLIVNASAITDTSSTRSPSTGHRSRAAIPSLENWQRQSCRFFRSSRRRWRIGSKNS